jgi:4-hydroxyphenylpyruvate dioxygenase-like putative hemolysin
MTTTQNTLGILKATALDHVTLSVKNLTESVHFYQTLFGFSLKQDQPEHRSQIIGNDTASMKTPRKFKQVASITSDFMCKTSRKL